MLYVIQFSAKRIRDRWMPYGTMKNECLMWVKGTSITVIHGGN